MKLVAANLVQNLSFATHVAYFGFTEVCSSELVLECRKIVVELCAVYVFFRGLFENRCPEVSMTRFLSI